MGKPFNGNLKEEYVLEVEDGTLKREQYLLAGEEK